MSNYVLELPLKTQKFQEDIIDKRLNISRMMYNALLKKELNKYNELIRTRKYRRLIASLTDDKKANEPIWKEINQMYADYGLTKSSFEKDIVPMQKHFSDNINSHIAQKIAYRLWSAFEDLIYGSGEELHFKKYGCFSTLEGKNNKTGIRFRNDHILWGGLNIPVIRDPLDSYESLAIQSDICFCRIKRKFIRNRYRYYVQLVLKTTPPFKHQIGAGDVGIDIGPSTIAYSSETDVRLLELADRVQNIDDQKRRLQRKMDRSRRAMNPQRFNEDGTYKEGSKGRWNHSNHYLKYRNQVKELSRKQAAVRKYQHECLANEIISLGDKIYVEKMDFKGLARKSKKTEKNDKGRYKRKKRFGKSIANRAPAMLLTIINRKLSYFGEQLTEIDTREARASQFDHTDQTYKKKKLSQRWNDIHDHKVQRDMYSSFLIMNVNNDLKSFDMKKCNDRYENFLRLHDQEVERLKGKKSLKSMGV